MIFFKLQQTGGEKRLRLKKLTCQLILLLTSFDLHIITGRLLLFRSQ